MMQILLPLQSLLLFLTIIPKIVLSLSAAALPRIIETNNVPIHLYTNEITPDAIEQLKLLAESPLPVDYVSAMPDVHPGYGVTIGTVFASKDYVCPNAVGVDIGCGYVLFYACSWIVMDGYVAYVFLTYYHLSTIIKYGRHSYRWII